MSPVVTLSFRYLPGEYVRAVNAHQRTRLRLIADTVFSLLVVGGGLYTMHSGGARYFWLGFMFCGVGLAVPVLIAIFCLGSCSQAT